MQQGINHANKDAMGWLLIQTLFRLLDNSGQDIIKEVNLTVKLCGCINAMLNPKEPLGSKGIEICKAEREALRLIRAKFDPFMDVDKISFSRNRNDFMDKIEDSYFNLVSVMCENNLIRPDLMKEIDNPGFGSIQYKG